MAEITERIGAAIRRLREKRKVDDPRWTQDYLARQLPGNRTGAEVSRWERGEVKPRDKTLEQIAAILETDVAELYAGPVDEAEVDHQPPDLLDNLSGQEAAARPGTVEAKVDALAGEVRKLRAQQTKLLARLATAEASPRDQKSPRRRRAQGQ